jgi:hypothetical protein
MLMPGQKKVSTSKTTNRNAAAQTERAPRAPQKASPIKSAPRLPDAAGEELLGREHLLDKSSTSTRAPTHEEICQRAYEIWEEEGRPDGRSQETWIRAEQDLRGGPSKS